MDDQLKEAAEDAEREKAFKDVVATVKEKGKVVEAVEKKAHAFE